MEHVSKTHGDGLGFDVLSYDVSGRERFIEVKTTSFGKETLFFITRNEVGFSKREIERFHFCFSESHKVFYLSWSGR